MLNSGQGLSMTKICRKCDREIENYYVLIKAMNDLEIVDNPDDCEFWAHKELTELRKTEAEIVMVEFRKTVKEIKNILSRLEKK